MNQQEKPAIYEDKINLSDYWKVIAKRKELIIGLLLVSGNFNCRNQTAYAQN